MQMTAFNRRFSFFAKYDIIFATVMLCSGLQTVLRSAIFLNRGRMTMA